MRKRSALWLTLILSGLLVLVAACGSNTPFSNSSATPTAPVGENIYVLDGYNPLGGSSAGQHIVAFHSGEANPTALVSLPAGLTSMDHQRLYTAVAHNGQTTISVVNTQSGTTMRSIVIDGTYAINGQSFSDAVVSFNGQWLALRQSGKYTNETTIVLIDTQVGKLVKTIHLNGSFDLDAVNPDGTRIYLIERLNDATGHYYVRLYNVAKNELYQAPIADKSEINDPRMTGLALTRQMSSDGRFAYTLYIDTFHNVAFVHILPLTDELYFARCLDLPVGKSADLLHYYTLTLSSDGTTLYAANGALGVVSKISLDSGVIFNDQIEATKHINPGTVSASSSTTHLLYNGAVLSAGDRTLYFAGMNGVWMVNTSDLNVQGHYLTQQALTGLALSSDSRTLYAVDPTHGITFLNAATGQPQQIVQGPAHNPWGIEWITK